MIYSLNDCAWYVIATLRGSCIESHLETLRRHYKEIPLYVIDNNVEDFGIKEISDRFGCSYFKNEKILPLTKNQIKYSKVLFAKHKILCFSADDINILNGGFIEKSINVLNSGAHIVSFSTDEDPVAYCYDKEFFINVGFNENLLGKECTDSDLKRRVFYSYGEFKSVGEFWRSNDLGWHSEYVLNPHCGLLGKTEVNQQLEDVGIDSGRSSNKNNLYAKRK